MPTKASGQVGMTTGRRHPCPAGYWKKYHHASPV